MTVPTNAYVTFSSVGIREDLEDMIYDISPTETPIMSAIARLKATQKTHEWQIDKLAAASATNSVIEGDDPTADAASPTNRLKNYTQLMDKVVVISSTNEASNQAGRESEMAYQMAKRSKELKRDVEAAIGQNNAGTLGSSASAALMASLESWLAYSGTQAATIQTANGTSVGEGSAQTTPGFTTANGVPVTAPTDSTSTGSLSEAVFKGCIANAWEQGGDPRLIIAGPRVKAAIASKFTGIATRYRSVGQGQADIIGGADLYVSDFGEHKLVPSRFVRSTTLFGIDPDYLGIAYLQSFKDVPLAKTGHSEKRMLSVECTLVVKNPFAHFKIGDISATKTA